MEDPRFAKSPLNLGRLQFQPKARVAMQITVTVVMLAALYAGYSATPKILAATETTGLTMPEGTELPGWAMIFIPVLAIIVGVYIFTFLKFNFNY